MRRSKLKGVHNTTTLTDQVHVMQDGLLRFGAIYGGAIDPPR
jgi:hypothetical protein